jgi:hypothetical protein
MFFVVADPSLHNEDYKPARIRIESVFGNGSRMIEMAIKELGCEKVALCVLQ